MTYEAKPTISPIMSYRFFASSVIAPIVIVAPEVLAVQYLSVDEAKAILFSEAKSFKEISVTLSDSIKKQIEAESESSFDGAVTIFEARDQNQQSVGYLFIDNVIGKHEFITYAVALSPEGSIRAVEILDYRENHGAEVRNAEWRKSFEQKKDPAEVSFNDAIPNISGATLSCSHLTSGIKKILLVYRSLLANS